MIEAFISFVICAILGFYLLGFIGRIALKFFIRKKTREFQEQFGAKGNYNGQSQSNWNRSANTNSSTQQDEAKEEEGKIHVQQAANTEKRVSRNVGEYVDFEEVK